MRKRGWRKERKGWIKVHIAVDVETKELLGVKVTDERTADHEMFEPLLDSIEVKDALADSAYDTREVFKFLKRKGRVLVHQGLRSERTHHSQRVSGFGL